MRVLARDVDWAKQPEEMKPSTRQISSHISVGKEYDVYGIILPRCFPSVLIFDNENMAMWREMWLFDIVDKSIPEDWISNVFHHEAADTWLALGPPFIVKDNLHYSEMVLQEPPTYDRFFIYRRHRLILEPLRILADMNLQKEIWLSSLDMPERMHASKLVEQLFVESGLSELFRPEPVFSKEATSLLDGMWAFVEFIDLERPPDILLADPDWIDFCDLAQRALPLVEDEIKIEQSMW